MKRILFSAGTALALATTAPLSAQDAGSDAATEELDQVMDMMTEIFPVEPLTPEEEARLPQAQRIVALVIPEGTMGKIMGDMIDDMLKPIMTMGGSGAKTALAQEIGVSPFELNMTDEEAADIVAMFDPVWAERQERELEAFPQMMREMMTLMEPGMRKAMSEAYATHFTTPELDGIEAFFATDIGAKYAAESFAMASDPRMMGASMEALPAMMQAMGDMEARIEESTADLPEARVYSDLTPAQRALVIEATGFTDDELRTLSEASAGSAGGWDSENNEAAMEPAVEGQD